jgi:hypothetical protein
VAVICKARLFGIRLREFSSLYLYTFHTACPLLTASTYYHKN